METQEQMQRSVPGRRRSERSRRAVLEAAAKLLTERGYADITIESIAAEAGVGKTTIYRWWPTKASIYIDLYAELAAKVTPPADTGDVTKDLSLLIRGAFRLYRNTAAGLALAGIVAEAQSNPEVSRIVRHEFAPSRRQIVKVILERAVERGEIRDDLELDLVCETISGAVWYCVLAGSAPLTDRHASRLIEVIVQGIVPGKPKARGSKRAERGNGKAE